MKARKVGTSEFTPLTPEERRALVEAPLPVVRVIGHSRAWGGTSVVDWTNPGKPSRAYSGGRYEWLRHLDD